ncbi:hypothetical protein [Olivibacter sitiensis]|uniref:hypothetical protein n=1 Tax=Olivibacter sitiensis TaxID=376470 RepID=UPI00040455FD|nr:hypothetical protein [Olivibacter sitiensis]
MSSVKSVIGIFLLIVCQAFWLTAQNKKLYFLLAENEPKEYRFLSKTELSSKTLYGGNIPVHLLNLDYDDGKLVLFSVLPKLNELRDKRTASNWKRIDIDTLKPNERIGMQQLRDMHRNGQAKYLRDGYDYRDLKKDDIVLVYKSDSGYVQSAYCLTEFFTIIDNTPLLFANDNKVCFINTAVPTLTAKEFENRYARARKTSSPNDVRNEYASLRRPLEYPVLFLSHSTATGRDTAYHYWLFSDWSTQDAPNRHRGIDRFVYVPGKGIIGGSFDFYFLQLQKKLWLSDNFFYEAYVKEQVMLPSQVPRSY